MTSDLERFRDHARDMADATHRPDCTGIREGRWGPLAVHPHPDCGGCVTDDDRVIWTRLATETEVYLARNTDATLEGLA